MFKKYLHLILNLFYFSILVYPTIILILYQHFGFFVVNRRRIIVSNNYINCLYYKCIIFFTYKTNHLRCSENNFILLPIKSSLTKLLMESTYPLFQSAA